ncbi:MAG: lantibiotic dehydratase, partial [Saprospiraceae bacterium]
EAESAQEVQQAFDTVLQGLPDSLLRTAVYNARKRFFQKQQAPQQGFEKMLLEHPHQPILAQLLDSLQDWKKSQSQKILAEDKVEAGLVGNWRIIQQAAEQPDFRKALLFASHDLLDRLPAFCVKAPEHFTAKDRQTGLTVLQYLTRGAYKTSPLSRFTTVSLWRWQQSFIPVDADEPAFLQAAKAVVTPNVALLPALYEVLLGEPVFYQSLLLGLNPCIVTRSGENGRQWLYFDGENESFQQLNPNPAVEAVIRICLDHQRQISWRALLKELQTTIDADESRLQGLIHELVALGLLAWQLPERGLTPGWCGNLYNYLGYLQLAPVILEAAALLQWLRTAARTLPFQSVAEAQTTQRQTVQQVKAFFERYNGPSPPIPAEQIFFEDVEKSQPIELPPEIIQDLADQLADCWRSSGPQYLSTFRAALYAFTVAEMAFGEARPFLDFCKTFLSQKADWEKQPPVAVPPFQGKMGALIQVIKKENGSYGAVVNGLFPGGGKLMARWLHLFPVEARESLQAWFPNDAMAFPWQGWSNANFQPELAATSLAVPDGRIGGAPGGPSILLGDLAIQRGDSGPIL